MSQDGPKKTRLPMADQEPGYIFITGDGRPALSDADDPGPDAWDAFLGDDDELDP